MIGSLLAGAVGNVAGALGGMANPHSAANAQAGPAWIVESGAALNVAPGGYITYYANRRPPSLRIGQMCFVSCAYCDRGRAQRDEECEGCGATEVRP